MGENTKIEWTDHTFNPWQGCIKISPGCTNCYALTLSNRWGRDIWGPGPKRSRTSPANWQKPIQWDKKAGQEGRRVKVFCASMADVFEDNPQVQDWRSDLWDLIELTPNLDWLLLTKRPENIKRFTKRWETWEQLPANIWLGTSVENQEYADKRIPELLKVPAAVRFLSAEPLIGPIDLRWCDWCGRFGPHDCEGGYRWAETIEQDQAGIDWVIIGGESGHGARPMHPDWARSLRDQCQAAGVACHFKQWGEFVPGSQLGDLPQEVKDQIYPYRGNPQWMDRNGAFDDEYFPPDGYIPNAWADGWDLMSKVGKKLAGRLLDGREWNEFPKITEVTR